MTDSTHCAGIYFDPQSSRSISWQVLEDAVRLLSLSSIPIREFEVSGVPAFSDESIHSFPQQWDTLRAEVRKASLTSFRLYAHSSKDDLPLTWQASVGIDLSDGSVYFGVPEIASNLRLVLLNALELTRLVAPPRYGIAYRRSACLAPGLYAIGMLGRSGGAQPDDDETRLRITRWFDELRQSRRHLRGWFRSVYPFQLLSELHRKACLVNGQTLAASGLGAWEQISDELWLWELPKEELPKALALLSDSGLLLSA
jgi:hypothetical protein